jgi:hypothetical protein
MGWDELSALAALGQFFLLVAAAVLAYWQLGGLRRQQEAQVVQRIFEKLNNPVFAAALDFVYNELPERLKDPDYVKTIREGRATAASHRELVVMHFFNELGLMVHDKLVCEYPIVTFVATPCIRSWDRLAPVVELMRRRFPHAYTPFEELVARSRRVDFAAINARFRTETPHLHDEWERTARELSERRITLPDDPEVAYQEPRRPQNVER